MHAKDGNLVRYAVVGLGNIAQVAVLPAFTHAKRNSKLVALISSDAEKLRKLGAQYEVAATGSYDDFERTLAAARADAVYLTVPNALHRTFVERAAAAGVHILCEKPMAMTSEDCAAMSEAARAAGVRLMIAYRLHFERANATAIEQIRTGAIGTPQIFSSVFTHDVREGDIRTREEMGGGALFDMGIYCVNAARYLFQDEPISVLATQIFGSAEHSSEVDDITSAIVRFPGNKVAQFTTSQGSSSVSEYRVVGTKGDIRLEPAYEYTDGLKEYATIEGKQKEKAFPARDQFAPEILHFSDCILEGKDPGPSAKEGLADVRILEAIQESARTGQEIQLDVLPHGKRPNLDQVEDKPKTKKVKTIHAPSPSK